MFESQRYVHMVFYSDGEPCLAFDASDDAQRYVLACRQDEPECRMYARKVTRTWAQKQNVGIRSRKR